MEWELSATARAGGSAGSLPGFPTAPLLLSECSIRALPSFFPDKGSIHKVVELPDGVQNIMELQVFPKKDPIQSMILDHKRVGLYVERSGCSFKSRKQGRQGQRFKDSPWM